MNQPFLTIDVVIASLNEERSIADCINAVKEQSYPPELVNICVAVDPKTADRTKEIASSAGVTVVTSDKSGAGAVRNYGMRKGSGDLVAFLDAHSVPTKSWLSELASCFTDDTIGGAQGGIDYHCTNGIVQKFIAQGMFSNDERLTEHTVEARFSPYPWIVGGNCMFRRPVLEDVWKNSFGLINDDVERSWLTVLAGYRLVANRKARLTHVDHSDLGTFLARQYRYGEAAAQVRFAFGIDDFRNDERRYVDSHEAKIMHAIFELGLCEEASKLQAGESDCIQICLPRVRKHLRPAFEWTDNVAFALSEDVIFWTDHKNNFVVVNSIEKSRMYLEEPANVIFNSLTSSKNRAETVSSIADEFAVDQATAATDLDEFIETLRAERVLTVAK